VVVKGLLDLQRMILLSGVMLILGKLFTKTNIPKMDTLQCGVIVVGNVDGMEGRLLNNEKVL